MNTKLQTQTQRASALTPSVTRARTGLLQRKCACGGTPGPTGECAECRRKRLSLQRRSGSATRPPTEAPPVVHEVLRSPGRPLDAYTRAFMEPRFGHDFGKVRVHSDAKAGESARTVDALAYTVGQDIVFGAGQYAPGTIPGQRLLAHELAHTVQQSSGASVMKSDPETTDPGDTAEREAEEASRAIARGEPVSVTPGAPVRLAGKSYHLNLTTSGCDRAPWNRAMVIAAAIRAFNQVLNTTCVGSEALEDRILWEFDGLTLECKDYGEGGEDRPCGGSRRYLSQTIKLYTDAIESPRSCGPLESTILHEAVHLTEWVPFVHGELAAACEKSCFGFGKGDASKCK
jgi:hypothetical protein